MVILVMISCMDPICEHFLQLPIKTDVHEIIWTLKFDHSADPPLLSHENHMMAM